MLNLSFRVPLRYLLIGMVAVSALVLTACGDEDLCADVSCEFGACDSASGQCVNPDQCRFDDDCMPGYECGESYACEPVQDCTADDECEAGVCQDGACVNPSSCASNDDCVARTFCGPGGTCEADPCNDVTCQRGVCERGTDNCVSADSCTADTETLDCVAGEKCAEGTCAPAESFCDDISCDRGECSFEAGGCASAADCEGDDTLCAEGEFCNESDQCQPDLCVINEIDCGDNGVCIPSAGACQNATSCAANSDCTAGHLCVDGTCRLEAVACGDAGGTGGCPGNQLCEYDESNLTASCTEPPQCETSFDCAGDRQCGGLNCVEPVSCQDDYFEPNDISDEATDFLLLAEGGTMSGSVCSGDTDFYFFDSSEIVDASMRGTLLIELDVPARDQGLGQIEVELTDPTGATQDSSTGALGANGKVRIEKSIGLTDHGEYTVEVRAADDLKDAGVRYDLSVNLLPNETVKACEDALPLKINQRISGTTEGSDSQYLGSSCTSDPNPAAEKVYALELDAPQEVTFTLTPQLSSTDMTMSLRSRCSQASSERACSNDKGEGGSEVMTALLEAGTHYLVVQGADGGAGAFELVVDTIYTACAKSDSYCEDGQIAQLCTTNGGRFTSLDCDAGCNPSTGRCFPPDGDVCFSAPLIDADTSFEIQLGQLNNEYDLSESGCGEDAVPNSDGPEQTFEITVPAQKAVTADVNFANEVEGSLYFVENCGDASNTCQASASGSVEDMPNAEVLSYANFSQDQDVTLFLVVDTRAGQAFSTADLQVTYYDISCVPGDRQCDGAGDVEMCDDYGIDYRLEEECGDLQCGSGHCLDGDTCDRAIPLVDGDTVSKPYDGITSHITTGTGDVGQCTFTSSNSGDAPEYIFSIDLKLDEVLTVTYDASTSNGIMYLMETCGDANSCLVNGGRYSSSGTHELQYLADQDKTVYLAVSRNTGTSSYYDFNLAIDISPVECDPAVDGVQCKDANTLEYCDEPGIWKDYSCDGGCTNGECGTPSGKMCLDPIVMTDGDTDEQYYDGGNNVDPVAEGNTGNCTFGTWDDTEGHDRVYAVDLLSGETLTATYGDGPSSNYGASYSTIMYIMTDCSDGSTCQSATSSGSSGSLTYTASQDETVYVIMDRTSSYSTTYYSYELDIAVQ